METDRGTREVYLGVFQRLIDCGNDGERLRECAEGLRGNRVALPWPSGYNLEVCLLEDTILTDRDIRDWCEKEAMGGVMNFFGTVGHTRNLSWDRKPVALSASGAVYCYHLADNGFHLVRVADSMESLLRVGLVRSYFGTLQIIRETTKTRRSARLSSKQRGSGTSGSGYDGLGAAATTSAAQSGYRRRAGPKGPLRNVELTEEMYREGCRSASMY